MHLYICLSISQDRSRCTLSIEIIKVLQPMKYTPAIGVLFVYIFGVTST